MTSVLFNALSQIEELSTAVDEGARIESYRNNIVTLALANGSEQKVSLELVKDLLDDLRGISHATQRHLWTEPSDLCDDKDQLRKVLTFLVEDGDTWAILPKEIRDAAMAQFLRLEGEST